MVGQFPIELSTTLLEESAEGAVEDGTEAAVEIKAEATFFFVVTVVLTFGFLIPCETPFFRGGIFEDFRLIARAIFYL